MSRVTPDLQLLLYRHAECAWSEALRPWFEASRGKLIRSYVVVATRGQAYGLKQRCLISGVPLLGVEFLTPGLARKKWLRHHLTENAATARPAIGRELLLFGLRVLVAERLKGLTPENADWGFWKSFQSDPERALDDFDTLLKAGFSEIDFALPALCEIFCALRAWLENLGYDLAATQSERAALSLLPSDAAKFDGRLLIYGLSAELWPEFSNVAALARRFSAITALLPSPEFRGRNLFDENWIELWRTLLGVEPSSIDEPVSVDSCEAVGLLWSGQRSLPPVAATKLPGRIIVGRTRRDEMELVADEIAAALANGGQQIGVIFPQSDAASAWLTRGLERRRIQFHTTLELTGAAGLESILPRSLIGFHQQGATWEGLLQLWPLLKNLGRVTLTLGFVRALAERLFDEQQTHGLIAYQEILRSSERVEWKEVSQVVERLLPPFPNELTIADALARFETLCTTFEVAAPPGLGTLRGLGERETRVLPLEPLLATLLALIPEGVAAKQSGEASFARVTLLTRRRAEGLNFSHLFLVEANAGIWPRRTEATPWLSDEVKQQLNERSRFSLGLYTSEDRAAIEKQSFVALARDAAVEVIFSASLYDEADPESRLGPNSWVERVLWYQTQASSASESLGEQFEGLALSRPREELDNSTNLTIDAWLRIWKSRRNPAYPFDEYFCSVDPLEVRPDELPARLLERAAQDPAELWFGGVLHTSRIDWEPLVRARRKALGQWAHRLLAKALQPQTREGIFGTRTEFGEAQTRLENRLAELRRIWPGDRYWESFYLELSRLCHQLLNTTKQLPEGGYVATELSLREASVDIGENERLRIRGRIDFIWADRPEWKNAQVEIVDFKTGSDATLSADRMSRNASSLQLGVYLAAAESLGIRDGRVWMLKPQLDGFSFLERAELPRALAPLRAIGRHLRSGVYGSLTPDPSPYQPEGCAWPLACVPISLRILESKFAVSFPEEFEVHFE